MSLVEAVVLGLLQGLTEFLPISSSAHLRIVPAFLGWQDPGAEFPAVLQLGTMAAELVFFRVDLVRIARAWWRSLREPAARGELDARLGWYLIFATIPIGVFGLAFEDSIETTARDLRLIAVALIGLGLVLFACDRAGSHDRGMGDLRLRDGLVMGAAQTLALIPGVSRSGATLSAGLALGLQRAVAARFSFLLSIPAVVLSGAFELSGMLAGDGRANTVAPATMLVAIAVAFVCGYVAIVFLLRYLSTHTTAVFVVYRVLLGSVVLTLVLSGVIA